MPPPLHYLRSAFHEPQAALPAQHALGKGSHQFFFPLPLICQFVDKMVSNTTPMFSSKLKLFFIQDKPGRSGQIPLNYRQIQGNTRDALIYIPLSLSLAIIILHLDMALFNMRSNLMLSYEIFFFFFNHRKREKYDTIT